ncbi:MAG: isoaspartyl peptidase/L-asparaginase [Bacteroidota bacterium]|nr:isoaspartyl peptidase/L-asparaginase [Bacteroidota bacterium]
MKKWGIAIHGGAGRLPYYGMSPEREKDYKMGLKLSLDIGNEILKKGGSALDAIENSIKILENNPLFNAGKGAVFTENGNNRMDASIMCGKNLKAGAICRVMYVKNPIALARALMEDSENLFLGDEGAQDYAKKMGLDMMPPHYFFTQERYDQWQEEKQKKNQDEHGTVGAVALDMDGNLAAGTSSGGLIDKNEFRIGDSALIGAGTYANNKTCAVSCTGKGESIIRAVVAHEISSMLLYQKIDLNNACENTMKEKLIPFGGHAGFVAMDNLGNVKFIHNSDRMYRGYMLNGEQAVIDLY